MNVSYMKLNLFWKSVLYFLFKEDHFLNKKYSLKTWRAWRLDVDPGYYYNTALNLKRTWSASCPAGLVHWLQSADYMSLFGLGHQTDRYLTTTLTLLWSTSFSQRRIRREYESSEINNSFQILQNAEIKSLFCFRPPLPPPIFLSGTNCSVAYFCRFINHLQAFQSSLLLKFEI